MQAHGLKIDSRANGVWERLKLRWSTLGPFRPEAGAGSQSFFPLFLFNLSLSSTTSRHPDLVGHAERAWDPAFSRHGNCGVGRFPDDHDPVSRRGRAGPRADVWALGLRQDELPTCAWVVVGL